MQKRTFLAVSGAAALVSAVIFGSLSDRPANRPELSLPVPTAKVPSSSLPTVAAPDFRPAKGDAPVAATSEPRSSAAAFVPGTNPIASQRLLQRADTFSAPAPRSNGAPYRRPAASSQSSLHPTTSARASGGTVSGLNTAPAVASGFNPGGISLSPTPGIAVELDRGVQLPIALLAEGAEEQARTPAQSAVKGRIAAQFAEQINQAATVAPVETTDLDSVWSSAQARANWEYQKFFGGEAANRAGLRAGLEALAEP